MMNHTKKLYFVITVGLLSAALMGNTLAANQSVKVSLWDLGSDSMSALGKGEPMGMAMSNNPSTQKATMGIRASAQVVKAGKTTFVVTNDAKQMVHEMIVSPIKNTKTALPYNKDTLRIDEDAAGSLGEVSELAPGKKNSLTLDLKPGQYILYCNIPGHYVLGMWTLLTVK
jgi:uncharacterized cupredoxin-like copper-binding protein